MGGPGSGPRPGQGAGGHKIKSGKGGFSRKQEKAIRKYQDKLKKQGQAPFKLRSNLSKLISGGMFKRSE